MLNWLRSFQTSQKKRIWLEEYKEKLFLLTIESYYDIKILFMIEEIKN